MHAISSYHGNRPTNTVTSPQTGPITIRCAAANAQCNYCSISAYTIHFHVASENIGRTHLLVMNPISNIVMLPDTMFSNNMSCL